MAVAKTEESVFDSSFSNCMGFRSRANVALPMKLMVVS
jgi:hypothetical protein